MFYNICKLILSSFIFSLLLANQTIGEIVKKIEIIGIVEIAEMLNCLKL